MTYPYLEHFGVGVRTAKKSGDSDEIPAQAYQPRTRVGQRIEQIPIKQVVIITTVVAATATLVGALIKKRTVVVIDPDDIEYAK